MEGSLAPKPLITDDGADIDAEDDIDADDCACACAKVPKKKTSPSVRRLTCHTKEHHTKLLHRKLQRQVTKFEEKLAKVRADLAQLDSDDQVSDVLNPSVPAPTPAPVPAPRPTSTSTPSKSKKKQ